MRVSIYNHQLCVLPPSLHGFYPDPASPGDSRALEAALRIRAQSGTGGELETRLRYIRAALKPDSGLSVSGEPAPTPTVSEAPIAT